MRTGSKRPEEQQNQQGQVTKITARLGSHNKGLLSRVIEARYAHEKKQIRLEQMRGYKRKMSDILDQPPIDVSGRVVARTCFNTR
jgi:hypothetical protein